MSHALSAENAKPTINLGCGRDPWGDVRVDYWPHNVNGPYYNLDIEKPLPFKDKEFSQARLFHVLEHCQNPQQVFNEARRIADHVHVKCPLADDRVSAYLNALSSFQIIEFLRYSYYHISSAKHPQHHHWTIIPPQNAKINHVPFPSLFGSGRKSRILSRLTLKLPIEWEWVY